MSDEVADLLDAAAEYIEENGWIRNKLRSIHGGVCTVGGMVEVLCLTDEQVYDDRVLAACRTVAQVTTQATHTEHECVGVSRRGHCTCVVSWVTQWNDYAAKDQQQVLDALRKSEKIERMGYDPDLGYSNV